MKHPLRNILVLLLALARPPVAQAAGTLETLPFSEIGIPYAWKAVLDDHASLVTPPDHTGAWSWDEDNFPETAKGWTHTSKWLQLELTQPAALTLKLASLAGVPWPSAEDPNRLAGTNLFPSFSLYRGWDLDRGSITNADGTTLDQDHTFNNRGNIVWAEDVTYLDHLDNASAHEASRTWVLPAGQYTLNLGGNSPATLAEGRQGLQATLTTTPVAAAPTGQAALATIDFSEIGIPYAWKAVLDDHASLVTPPDHTGAWSWDEDNFPETAKGWTHTSKWLQLELTQPAALTLKLASLAGVPWPSAEDPNRLAGTNLFPSFSLYRGWDLDRGSITNADGTTLDQDHTFNNRGNIVWAEDATYLDHLDNASAHEASRTWVLPAGQYTLNLGGNSPATLAEGRQGLQATLTTTPVATLTSGSATIDFDQAGWNTLAAAVGPAPVLTLDGFFPAADAHRLLPSELGTNAPTHTGYTGQVYSLNGATVTQAAGRTSQPTTFAYLPGDPMRHTGVLGLGGVARFSVLGGLGGHLLFGDYTLQFDAQRIALGGTGWYLKGNIPPEAAAFDLLNVQITESANELRLAGDLAVSFEVANLLYGTPADTLKVVGRLAFQGTPSTARVPMLRSITLQQGTLTLTAGGGTPGAACTLLISSEAAATPEDWSAGSTGTFNAQGECTFTAPWTADSAPRFFRVRTP